MPAGEREGKRQNEREKLQELHLFVVMKTILVDKVILAAEDVVDPLPPLHLHSSTTRAAC